MFKKFFTYPVFLVLFLSIIGSILFGFSIKYYAGGGKKILYLRDVVYFIAEIPKPIINMINSKSLNPNKPKIPTKHKDKKRQQEYKPVTSDYAELIQDKVRDLHTNCYECMGRVKQHSAETMEKHKMFHLALYHCCIESTENCCDDLYLNSVDQLNY